MSRTLRIIAIVAGVLVVLLLIVPFLIPVNQFRPTIEEKASAALGRKVQLGNLSLSLLSGSLAAEDLSVADDPKFSPSPFLTAKSIKVGVEMMPLIFSRTLNITGIAIDDPHITLLRNPAGNWNYASLASSEAKAGRKLTSDASRGSGPSSGSEVSIKRLDLNDGSIIVGSTNSQKRSTYDHVSISASDVSLASKFPVTITAKLPGGGDVKLEGTVGPVNQSDTSLTPLDAKIAVKDLNLASTGFLDPALGLGGLLDLDATLASQNGEAQTKGKAKLGKALLIAGGSPASVPANVDFSTRYDLRRNSGVLNPSTLKIGNAAAHLSGTYQSPGETTVVNIKLEGQNMPAKDLAAFLPAIAINLPKGAALESGTLSTNLNITGPTDRLVTSGNVGVFSAKLSGFDLGSKMAAISALTGVKSGRDLEIEKLTTNLHMAPDGLRAENFLAVLPALGTLAGNGSIDAKNNLDFKMAATLASAAASGASGATPSANNPGAALGGLLGKVTGGSGGCKNATTIPFLIQGTASDPKFVPDVGGIAAGMLKSQLGCLGSAPAGSNANQQQPSNNPLDALGGLFGKKKKP